MEQYDLFTNCKKNYDKALLIQFDANVNVNTLSNLSTTSVQDMGVLSANMDFT
ncbi:10843_t:CDS:1, partial [Ambispora gerdemannii]